MTLDDAARRLTAVLKEENAALGRGDVAQAMRLLPEKQQAAVDLRAALPGGKPDRATTEALRSLADENATRLLAAIDVQARILEMVARAARHAAPGAVGYGAKGGMTRQGGAMAIAIKA